MWRSHGSWRTYELEGHAAGFDAANGNVEEDTGALYTWSVSIRIFIELSSPYCDLVASRTLTGVGHNCAIEAFVSGVRMSVKRRVNKKGLSRHQWIVLA